MKKKFWRVMGCGQVMPTADPDRAWPASPVARGTPACHRPSCSTLAHVSGATYIFRLPSSSSPRSSYRVSTFFLQERREASRGAARVAGARA